MKISITIPIYNEEGTIPILYRRLTSAINKDFKNWKYELIFVDDGSNDSSFKLLKEIHKKDKNVKIIQFSRNFGHHIALTAALDYVKGDFVVLMDGDLQNKPEDIIKLYNKLKKGYDIVYADSVNKKHSFFKRFNSLLFNKLIRYLVKEDIIINSSIFRIMKFQVVKDLRSLRESNRYLIGIIGWVGYKTGVQKVTHGKRYAGKTKYNYSNQINLALDAIFSFSSNPLRIFIKIGLFIVFLSFLFSIYAVYRKLFLGTTFIGWTSLIIITLAIGGFQIILLGVIGEYIERIYSETKNRPLYIIKQKYL